MLVDGAEVDGKECSSCSQIKEISKFHKGKCAGEKTSWCKECTRDYAHSYYLLNKDRYAEYSAKRRREKPEEIRASRKKWVKNNPGKVIDGVRRYQRKKDSLLEAMSNAELTELEMVFGKSCSLSGETDEVHLDHWVAVSTLKGGTTPGNIYPLSKALNSSKKDANPFEWIKSRPDINPLKFDSLVRYLAQKNNMTVEEFTTYTNLCYRGVSLAEEDVGGVA